MKADSFVIREARPCFEEGLLAAKFIEMSSEGLIPSVFGVDYRDIVATAFTQENNDFSFQNAIFAEVEGEIVGMALGFTGAAHAKSSDAPILSAPGNKFRRKLGLTLLNAFVRMMGGYPVNDFYIAFMAVEPEFRGRGIAKSLLYQMEEKGRREKAERLALHVSGGNCEARQLYEKFGFILEKTNTSKKRSSSSGGRMTKDIGVCLLIE